MARRLELNNTQLLASYAILAQRAKVDTSLRSSATEACCGQLMMDLSLGHYLNCRTR